MDYAHLEEYGAELTERIWIAERAGDQSLVDYLVRLKRENNQQKAKYVIVGCKPKTKLMN